MDLKKFWQQRKMDFFCVIAVLLVILDFVLAYPNLYLVTIYILAITFLIVRIQKKYREPIHRVLVPSFNSTPAKEKAPLSLAAILEQEFEYIKETASQAMNDRHTMVNYFLLSTGVVLAGIGVMVSKEGGAEFRYRYEIIVALGLLSNTVGWVYFMQVVRLRQAWCESARAMNHLKQFFVEHCEYPAAVASTAFRWNIQSIPPAAKKMTVFYFSALLISILSAGAIVLASVILVSIEQLRSPEIELIPPRYLFICMGLGLYHLLFQMSMYTALLEEVYVSADEQQSKSAAAPAPSREKPM